jgi:murein hydrolase activator
MKHRFSVWLLCAGISPALWAETDAEKAHELAVVHAQRQRVDAAVKKLALEKSAQLEQLRNLEKQYGDQINTLNSLKAEVQQQENALQNVRNKIATTQKDIQTQRHGLEGLIKSAHAMGDKQGLDVLLNQKDAALSGRMLAYYNYISKARIEKLNAIQDDMLALNQLESQKDTENQLLQVSLEKKQQETDELQALKDQREKLLTQIDHNYALKRQELTNLIHDEKKLEALLASLQKTDDNAEQTSPPEPVVEKKPPVATAKQPRPEVQPKSIERPKTIASPKKEIQTGIAFAELQGKLPWPVQGAIVERFGSRRFETTWDGTVIAAREGAAIHAVATGRVVYADWLRGYGLMIIVDHGKGFMSLYAFNQSLHKSLGEYVRAGETLASVGRSGGRSRAALYFGIRKKGKAVNPEKWCRKPGKG